MGSESDQSFPRTRVNHFAALAVCTSAGMVATAFVVLIAADQLSLHLAPGTDSWLGASWDNCNIRVVAKAMFWSMFVAELATAGRLLFFPFAPMEIRACRARGHKAFATLRHRGQKLVSERRMIIAAVLAALFAYYGTYYMAYGGHDCVEQRRFAEPTLYYWMLGVFGLRAFLPACIVDLWMTASARKQDDR